MNRSRSVELVEGFVLGDQLRASLRYNGGLFRAETMERLADGFRAELLAVMDHCLRREEAELTPSDIDYDGLGIDELDEVLDSLG